MRTEKLFIKTTKIENRMKRHSNPIRIKICKRRITRILCIYILFLALLISIFYITGKWEYLFDGKHLLVRITCISALLLSFLWVFLMLKKLVGGLKELIISDEGLMFLYVRKSKNEFVPWNNVEAIREHHSGSKKVLNIELKESVPQDTDRHSSDVNIGKKHANYENVRILRINRFDCRHQEIQTLLKSRLRNHLWKKDRYRKY